MSDLLPLFLAGLAFFFVGVAGISEHLRQISGRGLRQRLARLTRHPLRAGLCGLLFGMLTQSASAVAFILAGMISTGLMAVRRALPVLACANVGTALLVFLAALDIRVAALYLLGVSGIVVAFKVTGRWRAAAGTSFAVGMLFYGLVLMKQAVAPLPGHPDFAAVVAFIQGWPYAAFVLGAMLRIVVQSSSAIGVIAVTLAGAGLLNDLQAMLLLCGVCVGVGLAAYLMSAGLAGIPRQIIAYQALINVVAGSVFAVLLLAEHLSGTPLILGGLQAFASSLDGRIAAFYLLLMLGCLGAGLALQPWAPLWIERWFPPRHPIKTCGDRPTSTTTPWTCRKPHWHWWTKSNCAWSNCCRRIARPHAAGTPTIAPRCTRPPGVWPTRSVASCKSLSVNPARTNWRV